MVRLGKVVMVLRDTSIRLRAISRSVCVCRLLSDTEIGYSFSGTTIQGITWYDDETKLNNKRKVILCNFDCISSLYHMVSIMSSSFNWQRHPTSEVANRMTKQVMASLFPIPNRF